MNEGNTVGHKFSAATIAAGVTAIAVWVLKEFYGIVIPGEAAVGVSGVLTPIVSILLPDKLEKGE